MSPAPVAQYLREFASDGAAGRQHRAGGCAYAHPGDPDPCGAARAAQEAYERGLQEGKAAAAAEMDVKLDQQRRLADERLATERQAWCTQLAASLTASLQAGLRELEATIAAACARVLVPFLNAQVARQAHEELLELVHSLASSREGTVTLEIAAPEPVLSKLRTEIADLDVAVTLRPHEDGEIRVKADSTILETRIGAWMARIAEVAG